MYRSEKKDPAKLRLAREILLAASALGAAGSIALPWPTVSCWLFVCASLGFAFACLHARRQDADFNRGWKFALAAVVVFSLSPTLMAWEEGALRLLVVIVEIVLLYLSVTMAVTGLARAENKASGGRPPRQAMLFEYATGVYALIQLAADAFPKTSVVMQPLSMIALGFGFAQLLVALWKEAFGKRTGEG